MLLRVLLLAVLAAALAAPAFAFDNTEPLAAKQWYLVNDNAWTYWPSQPQLFPVSVAVIDSGIDGTHPDLAGRVVAARSFVSGSAYRDEQGHGTFVAGEIAANPANNDGIAGLGVQRPADDRESRRRRRRPSRSKARSPRSGGPSTTAPA